VPEKKTILIATPTREEKKYCEDDFIEALLNLEVPENAQVDILLLCNGEDWQKIDYYKHLADKLQQYGTFFTIANVSLGGPEMDIVGRMTMLYNMIRGYCLKFDFDYLFTLESDVIAEKDALVKLFDHAEAHPDVGMVSGVTEYIPADVWQALIKEGTCRDAEGRYLIPSSKVLGQNYNTLIFKQLAMVDEIAGEQPFSLPVIMGNKADWFLIPLAVYNKWGNVLPMRAYKHDEMLEFRNIGKPIEVEGAPLGCALIRADFLQKYTFRHDRRFGHSCDLFFSKDMRRAGRKIVCLPDVWCEHRNIDWTVLGIFKESQPVTEEINTTKDQ